MNSITEKNQNEIIKFAFNLDLKFEFNYEKNQNENVKFAFNLDLKFELNYEEKSE